ncbi:MAG: ABC transporter substrate-binding protein [Eubacterium sp.]|nr:ABC transporter substrate-binding protein [Eubacterium sp.]
MRKPAFFATFIILSICTMLLSACQSGTSAEDIPMGRYVEREINLPGTGYEYMHPLADGGYYLHGNGVDFTKTDADGEIRKTSWSWEEQYNIRLKTVFGINDDGAVIFAFVPRFYTDEELEALGTDDEIYYKYYYVDAQGGRRLLSLHGDHYTPKEFFEHFSFAPDGRLYGATDRHVCRIDLSTEEVEPLFETTDPAREFAFLDDIMVVIDQNRSYLYDMTNDKLLDDNSVLNEFLSSHQSASIVLAVGNVSDMSSHLDDKIPENGNADGKVLYIGCHTGLYRYIWDGSVIEQIADGQLLTLGNSQYEPLAMQALSNGEFRILFSGNHMVELYYDETIPSRPSRELTVYSLEEDTRIRYAGQLFQNQNPDVLVVYETGMDGDNAVNREDALKNLNTRLLAGEGPDVLILDNINIEQYAAKGILKALDEFLLPYKKEGVLYQNIVDGMRMTESKKIYAIPLNVYLPLYLSETKYLDGQTTLPDLVTGTAHAREEHPDGPILYAPYQVDILNELLPVCLPAWTTEDGSLQTDKIAEFYRAADELWKLDNAGMDEARRKLWQEDSYEIDFDRIGMNLSRWVAFGDYDETWIQLGYATRPCQDMRQIHLTYFSFRETGGYLNFKQLDDVYAMGYGRLDGQAQNVYWVHQPVGIYEQAKEPELAEDFLTLLLSDEMMRKWWLGGGYPIRKESFAKILDINNREWAQVEGMNADSINIWYADYVWPTEEEKEWIYQILENASCPYLPGSVLEQTVRETGIRVLEGELTPEEGAAEVDRRMAIEMEE